MTNFARSPEIVTTIKKSEILTEGPVGVGTRIRETREMMGREATETMEVVDWHPPRLASLTAESFGTRYRSTFVVEPDPSGSKVTLEFTAEPQTFLAKVMAILTSAMIRSLNKVMAQDLRDCKAWAEAKVSKS